MGVIVVVCAVFGLTVSEAKTKIMCLRAKGGAGVHRHIQRRGQRARCTTRRTRLYTSGGTSTTMPTCPSRSTGAYATHGTASGSTPSNCTTGRALPSSSESGCYKSRGARDNAVRLRHVEPARVPLHDTLRRAHHRFLTRCIGWRKHNRADHSISCLDTLTIKKTGSESIETNLRRRRILFAGFFVARMEDTGLPKCVIFGEWWEARAVWGAKKN